MIARTQANWRARRLGGQRHPSRGAPGRGVQVALGLAGSLSLIAASPCDLRTPSEHESSAKGSASGAASAVDDPEPRIRELEASIAREQEALRALIGAGPREGEDPLHTSPEIRAIAQRLPALQGELRRLLEARDIARARDAATHSNP